MSRVTPKEVPSPYRMSTSSAANFCGYRDPNAFLRWAEKKGIRPSREVPKFPQWYTADLVKAMDAEKEACA